MAKKKNKKNPKKNLLKEIDDKQSKIDLEELSKTLESEEIISEKKPATKEIKNQKKKSAADKNQKKQKSKDKTESTLLADLIIAKEKKRRNIIIIISSIVLFLCAVAAILGFYYFNQLAPFAQENIKLSIEGPEKALIGEEITYTIKYSNQGNVDINNGKLIFQEPHGFNLISTEPQVDGHSWDLNELKVGQQGEVKIIGQLIDNFETEQELIATLIFEPENFHSEFSVEQSYYTAIEPLEFELEIDKPENITLGEKLNLLIEIENKNLNPIDKLKIKLIAPQELQITSTAPKTADDLEWLFTEFEPASVAEFKVEAKFKTDLTFSNQEERLKQFTLQLQYPNQEDQYFTLLEDTFEITIVDQELISYLIVNGSTEDKSVNLGDTLNFTLTAKNKGETSYQNLSMVAVINTKPADLLDWKNIDDEEYGKIEKQDYGKTITWSKLQIPELAAIKPDEEITINFAVPIKTLEDLQDISINELGKNAIETYSQLILTDDGGNELPAIESSKIILHLNSNVQLSNKALYYYEDGTPIGLGPLPPKANESTTYVIFWEITNKLHELQDLRVTATLPDNIKWTNNKILSTGEVTYNEQNHTLIWNINRLPTSAQKAEMTFHLQLTPQESDIGKLMKILNPVTLTATDAETQDIITQTMGALTTNLDFDENAIGNGIVEPQ